MRFPSYPQRTYLASPCPPTHVSDRQGQGWIRARQTQGCLWCMRWTDCMLLPWWDDHCDPLGSAHTGSAGREMEKGASRQNWRQGSPRLKRCCVISLLQDESLIRQSPVREVCPRTNLQMPCSCIVREGALPKQEGFCTVGLCAWVPLLLFVPSAEAGLRLGPVVQRPSPAPLPVLLPSRRCLLRARYPLTHLYLPACHCQRAPGRCWANRSGHTVLASPHQQR